jgi:dUTP pyrophosphatase
MVNVVLMNDEAHVPLRKTIGAAGYDMVSCEDTILPAMGRKLISTGVIVSIPEGFFGKIEARSSMAVKGIDVGAGVIDSDYRGEIKILLINSTNDEFEIKKGERVAQMILIPHSTEKMIVVDGLIDDTERGDGGFGSTN